MVILSIQNILFIDKIAAKGHKSFTILRFFFDWLLWHNSISVLCIGYICLNGVRLWLPSEPCRSWKSLWFWGSNCKFLKQDYPTFAIQKKRNKVKVFPEVLEAPLNTSYSIACNWIRGFQIISRYVKHEQGARPEEVNLFQSRRNTVHSTLGYSPREMLRDHTRLVLGITAGFTLTRGRSLSL